MSVVKIKVMKTLDKTILKYKHKTINIDVKYPNDCYRFKNNIIEGRMTICKN